MKRFAVVLFSCGFLLSIGWLAHVVWGQTAEAPKEKTYQVTQSQLDKYVAERIAQAVAADHEKKGGGAAAGPNVDEQVYSSHSWHYVVYHDAAYVVYTGPGQALLHPIAPSQRSGAPAKGGTGTGATPSAGREP